MFYATWCLLDCLFLLIARLWSVCFETDLFNFVLPVLLWMVCRLSSSTIFSCLNCCKIFLCTAYCNFIWPSFGVNASYIYIYVCLYLYVCMYKSMYFSHYFLMGKHTCTLIYVVVFSYEEVILINPDKYKFLKDYLIWQKMRSICCREQKDFLETQSEKHWIFAW